jgi:hypothetical protein
MSEVGNAREVLQRDSLRSAFNERGETGWFGSVQVPPQLRPGGVKQV